MSEYCKNCYELAEQLQAKEQECKKIKDKNQYMKDYIKTVETSRNELEQECEKLKTQTSNFMNGEYCANGCKKMHKQFKKVHNNLVEENKKLKQECEELKEELKMNQNFVCDGSIESTALCKILEKYKQALDEIEKIIGGTYYETEQTVKFKMQDIQDIINRTKGQ